MRTRPFVAIAIVLCGLLGVLLARQVVPGTDAELDVERPDDGVRISGQTTPRCQRADRTVGDCVLMERSAQRPVMAGGLIIATTGSQSLGLDPMTLDVRWEVDAFAGREAVPAGDDVVLLHSQPDLIAVSTATGAELWRREDPGMLVADERTVAAVVDEELSVRDVDTGRLRWRTDVDPGSTVVIGTHAGLGIDILALFQPGAARAVRHLRLADGAEVTPPALAMRQDLVGFTTGSRLDEQARIRTAVIVGDRSVELDSNVPGILGAALDGDRLLLAFVDRVEAWDARTGTRSWTFPADNPEAISADPVIVSGNGIIYRLTDPG